MTKTYHITQHRVFVPDTDLVTVALCMLAGGDPYAPSVNDEDTLGHHQVFNYVTAKHTLTPAGPDVHRAQTANNSLIGPLLHNMRDAAGTGTFGVLDAFSIDQDEHHPSDGNIGLDPTKHLTLTIGVPPYSTPLSMYGTTSHYGSLMTTWTLSGTTFDPDTCMRDVATDLLLAGIAKPAPHDHMIAAIDDIAAHAGPSHEPTLHGWNLPAAGYVADADPLWSVGGYTAGHDYTADMAFAPYSTRAAVREFTFDV